MSSVANDQRTRFVCLFSSEANAALLQERFTFIKNERDSLEADGKNKLALLMQKLKDLQVQNKTSIEESQTQSTQCEHLASENRQLLDYVVRDTFDGGEEGRKEIDECSPRTFRMAIARRTICSLNNSLL